MIPFRLQRHEGLHAGHSFYKCKQCVNYMEDVLRTPHALVADCRENRLTELEATSLASIHRTPGCRLLCSSTLSGPCMVPRQARWAH